MSGSGCVFKAAVWREDSWFIAQCLLPDVASQGGSEAEALDNLKEALRVHFSAPVADDSRGRAGEGAYGRAGDLKTFRDVRFFLEAVGFREITQLGSHAKFIKREEGNPVRTAVLPHYVDLAPAVVKSILRQANLSEN